MGHDRQAGALRLEPRVVQVERQLPFSPLEPDLVGPGDLGETMAAARLLLTQDDTAVDHLTGAGVADLWQRDSQPELTPQLDLDVADVTRPVDPPGHHRDPDGRHDRHGEQDQGRQDLANRAIHGNHPCLPECEVHHRVAMNRSRLIYLPGKDRRNARSAQEAVGREKGRPPRSDRSVER